MMQTEAAGLDLALTAANGDPQVTGRYTATDWTPPGPYQMAGALADLARRETVRRCGPCASAAQARLVVEQLRRAGQLPLLCPTPGSWPPPRC